MMKKPDIDFDPWLDYESEIDPILKPDAPEDIKKAWASWNEEYDKIHNTN